MIVSSLKGVIGEAVKRYDPTKPGITGGWIICKTTSREILHLYPARRWSERGRRVYKTRWWPFLKKSMRGEIVRKVLCRGEEVYVIPHRWEAG